MKYKIETNPSKEQLREIKLWLIQEEEDSGEGFLCNWEIIEKYFNENQLIILLLNQQPIGFTTWKVYDAFLLSISIAEVHPKYRSKGAGKFLMIESFAHLMKQGVKVVELFCEPRSSESFWRSLGFEDFKSDYAKHDLTLFKPLINVLEPKVDMDCSNFIELWNCEPHHAIDSSPNWTWSFNLKKNTLPAPILLSGGGDWNICWTKNGELMKESKVKYFSRSEPIANNGYVYITTLINP